MSQYSRRAAVGLLALSACLVGIAGCGSSSSTPQGRVHVLNALVGTTNNIDVTVNSTKVAQSVQFVQLSASFTVNSGAAIPISVLQTGTINVYASNAGATINQGQDNLIVVSGSVGAISPNAPAVNAFSVDLSAPSVSGQARVYFLNAAPFATGVNFSYSVNGGTPVSVPNVSYAQLTNPEFPQVGNSNTVTFNVTVTNGGEPAVASQTFTLSGGSTYVVMLTGRPQASGANPALALMKVQF